MVPVNLDNLREMLGNDKDMEAMIIKEFFKISEECIETMKKNLDDGYSDEFFQSSHALKGMALNIGAEKLGHICKETQDKSSLDKSIKENGLAEIIAEYNIVKDFLNK